VAKKASIGVVVISMPPRREVRESTEDIVCSRARAGEKLQYVEYEIRSSSRI